MKFPAYATSIAALACGMSNMTLAASPSDPPIVYAHYMHCYVLGAMADRVANDEPPFRDVSVAPDAWPEAEDKDRTWWSARLAPRSREGVSAVQEDFRLGELAGLDAFGFLIGDTAFHNQFTHGLVLAATVAQTSRVKLIPDVWAGFEAMDASKLQSFGEHLKSFMDQHPGAFLMRDGRYVISLGCAIGYGRKHDNFSEWAHVKPFFDAWGGPEKVFIIANTTWDPADLAGGWGDGVDALSMWAAPTGWSDRVPNGPEALPALAAKYHKLLSWPIHTTYYGGRKGCESMAECLGVSTFTDMWRDAIDRHVSLAAVQTWNDFSEDHAITETNNRGDSLILLNRYLADWYHKGSPPEIAAERVWLFRHRQLVGAHLSHATILAHNDSWHKTPTVDYLNVVTVLRKPASVTLSCGSLKWSIDAPEGLHEWLVYVPNLRTTANALHEAYTRADGSSYPVTTPERTITVASSLEAAIPIASVTRRGKEILTVRSKMPLIGQARWQDLSTVGDMAPE